jgi:hypothetical protein
MAGTQHLYENNFYEPPFIYVRLPSYDMEMMPLPMDETEKNEK